MKLKNTKIIEEINKTKAGSSQWVLKYTNPLQDYRSHKFRMKRVTHLHIQ